jgi:hypothetical protein
MNKFNQFGINTAAKSFVGTKVEIDTILNRNIAVHDFRIVDSKYGEAKGNGKCLHLQITIGETQHVVFTGSGCLMDQIQQVPKPAGFPFETKIQKESKRLFFS